MKAPFKRFSTLLLPLLLAAVALPSTACDEFELALLPHSDTVEIFSLARPENIGLPSAFDFYSVRRIVVEQAKSTNFQDFDMAFSELDGQFVVLPAGVFTSFEVAPGILIDSSAVSFDSYDKVPSEGYITDRPVLLRTDAVYAIRTRRVGCRRYAKMEVLELEDDGTVWFRFLRNNRCNDRLVTEPED